MELQSACLTGRKLKLQDAFGMAYTALQFLFKNTDFYLSDWKRGFLSA